jgi:hypothetical protein
VIRASRAGRWEATTDTDEFRDALCAYVTALRESGLNVVHTLLTVRRRTLAGAPGPLLDGER